MKKYGLTQFEIDFIKKQLPKLSREYALELTEMLEQAELVTMIKDEFIKEGTKFLALFEKGNEQVEELCMLTQDATKKRIDGVITLPIDSSFGIAVIGKKENDEFYLGNTKITIEVIVERTQTVNPIRK